MIKVVARFLEQKGPAMAVTITGQAKLKGLQHAEQNTILTYFKAFYTKGTITILGFAKATGTSAALAVGITGAAISVSFKGAGGAGRGGTEIFAVPLTEVGSGLSFVIAASIVGLVMYVRARRSLAA